MGLSSLFIYMLAAASCMLEAGTLGLGDLDGDTKPVAWVVMRPRAEWAQSVSISNPLVTSAPVAHETGAASYEAAHDVDSW